MKLRRNVLYLNKLTESQKREIAVEKLFYVSAKIIVDKNI